LNNRIIYADHAATTKLSQKAYDAMKPFMKEIFQNPSTIYSSARQPKKAISQSRVDIAYLIGAKPEEIIFTSGGTEADNWAIKNILFSKEKRKKIITSQIEHHAILNSCKMMEYLGYDVVYLPVDTAGIVHPDTLENEMDENTALVSIMLANNEIGSIQNIKELAEIAHKHSALFHTDAVQALGHIHIDVDELGIDMMSASAHKFNGPKGVGFLFVKNSYEISPYITGGNQEYKKRAGTENVAGIVGMAVALAENVDNLGGNIEYLKTLTDTFYDLLNKTGLDYISNGSDNRIPGNISLSFADTSGEMILHRLDLKGIEIATGSACDSKNTQISHVVKAISIPDRYRNGTIRLSLGVDNTMEDIICIVDELAKILTLEKRKCR
jgi:cysteine desulfurase